MALPPSLAALAAELNRRLADWIDRNPEGAARIALWMEDEMQLSAEERAPIDFLFSFIGAFVPPNWSSMKVGLQAPARALMAETGICLVWVPPAGLVEAIVAAHGREAREEVLLAGSAAILDSIDRALAEATHPRLEVSVLAAREAVAAHRAGFARAAQSLTATLLGDVVEGHFGFDGFGEARRSFERESQGPVGLWSARRTAVQEALRMAILQSRFRAPGEGFNRHLSAHGVDPRQFCEVHALEGLMLLAGVLRELHEVYRVAERGFGPTPRLSRFAQAELMRRMEAYRPPAILGEEMARASSGHRFPTAP